MSPAIRRVAFGALVIVAIVGAVLAWAVIDQQVQEQPPRPSPYSALVVPARG